MRSGFHGEQSRGHADGRSLTSGNAKVVSTHLSGSVALPTPAIPMRPNFHPTITSKPTAGSEGPRRITISVTMVSTPIAISGRHAPLRTGGYSAKNSKCRMADIRDGTSNTIAMAETTYDVWMGACTAWGYRGWYMMGVTRAVRHQRMVVARCYDRSRFPDNCEAGDHMGSLHPGGATRCWPTARSNG